MTKLSKKSLLVQLSQFTGAKGYWSVPWKPGGKLPAKPMSRSRWLASGNCGAEDYTRYGD